MEVKITITDICGAQCATCLQHRKEPKHTMSVEQLRRVLSAVEGAASSLFVNGTGDFLWLPNAQEYADILGEWFIKTKVPVSVTTNCGWNGRPRLTCSKIICSFNAPPDRFVALIGLDSDKVLQNIRYLSETHGAVEVHVLRWGHNQLSDSEIREIFKGYRVRIRVSEKVENQGIGHIKDEQRKCNYLDKLIISADGTVQLCCHDFWNYTPLGHVEDLRTALSRREEIKQQMAAGNTPRLCRWCNYPEPARIYYI